MNRPGNLSMACSKRNQRRRINVAYTYLFNGNLEVDVGDGSCGVIGERNGDVDLVIPGISSRRELDLDCCVVYDDLTG